MTTYYCDSCNNFTEDPMRVVEREKNEFWGEPVVNTAVYLHCPGCGYDELEEADECEFCANFKAPGRACGCPAERLDTTLRNIATTRVAP